MVRTHTLALAAVLAIAAAQSPPKFEVASVKRCKADAGTMRGGGESSPGRLNTGCDLLADDNSMGLIQRAYVRFAGGHANSFGVVPIEGAPSWLHSEAYRIEARAPGHPSIETMQGPMLQALLEERFRLKIRRTTKDGPVYALTVAKGMKAKVAAEGSCVPMPLTFPIPAPGAGQGYCKSRVALLGPAIEAEGSTIAEFGKLLNLVLDRPVIDRTGLAGRFDIHLEFARDDATPGLRGPAPDAASVDANRATIFTAIQEQLGLKLTATRGPVDVLVIDHVERPTKN